MNHPSRPRPLSFELCSLTSHYKRYLQVQRWLVFGIWNLSFITLRLWYIWLICLPSWQFLTLLFVFVIFPLLVLYIHTYVSFPSAYIFFFFSFFDLKIGMRILVADTSMACLNLSTVDLFFFSLSWVSRLFIELVKRFCAFLDVTSVRSCKADACVRE